MSRGFYEGRVLGAQGTSNNITATDKFENGKGRTTTSPFTNLSKLHSPQVLANPSASLRRLKNFLFIRSFFILGFFIFTLFYVSVYDTMFITT